MAKSGKNSKAIMKAMATLEKKIGEGTLMRMGDSNTSITTISSGRPDLDIALGGGYGEGKIIEFMSEEACGKTGLALEAIAEVQRNGGVAAIIDAEHALNEEYCELVGVKVEDLLYSQPNCGEDAIETIREIIDTAEVDLIIVDSISSLTPRAELEGEAGEQKMGLHAKLMGQFMKMIVAPAAEVGCTVILINQLRDSLSMYAPPKVTTGGKAIKFFASQRLEIKRKGWIKEGEETIGFKQHIKVIKNKVGAPFKHTTSDIIYGKGIDKLTSLIEGAVNAGVLIKAGAWYKYDDTNIAQGIAKLRIVLEDNPDLVDEIEKKLK